MAITVTLEDSGDHFFFSCHNDLYQDYDATIPSAFTDLCAEVDSLQQIYPPADNFAFTFTATTSATVHVMDSYANFNVTGSMTFSNIDFTGENALAVSADTDAQVTPPLATVPVKKCTITEPDGTHTALTITVVSSTDSLLTSNFVCTDSGFQTASIPMESEETCTVTTDSSTVESVRSCPGEPYHEDFFTFDSVTSVAYKRHRVLFNLYNWDAERSYTPASRATLTLTDCTFTYFLVDYEALIYVESNNMAVV